MLALSRSAHLQVYFKFFAHEKYETRPIMEFLEVSLRARGVLEPPKPPPRHAPGYQVIMVVKFSSLNF